MRMSVVVDEVDDGVGEYGGAFDGSKHTLVTQVDCGE